MILASQWNYIVQKQVMGDETETPFAPLKRRSSWDLTDKAVFNFNWVMIPITRGGLRGGQWGCCESAPLRCPPMVDKTWALLKCPLGCPSSWQYTVKCPLCTTNKSQIVINVVPIFFAPCPLTLPSQPVLMTASHVDRHRAVRSCRKDLLCFSPALAVTGWMLITLLLLSLFPDSGIGVINASSYTVGKQSG